MALETILWITLLVGIAALVGNRGYRAGYRAGYSRGNAVGLEIGERTAYNRIKKRENAQASLQKVSKIARQITAEDLPWMG